MARNLFGIIGIIFFFCFTEVSESALSHSLLYAKGWSSRAYILLGIRHLLN